MNISGVSEILRKRVSSRTNLKGWAFVTQDSPAVIQGQPLLCTKNKSSLDCIRPSQIENKYILKSAITF